MQVSAMWRKMSMVSSSESRHRGSSFSVGAVTIWQSVTVWMETLRQLPFNRASSPKMRPASITSRVVSFPAGEREKARTRPLVIRNRSDAASPCMKTLAPAGNSAARPAA